jgi:hypothetical protein
MWLLTDFSKGYFAAIISAANIVYIFGLAIVLSLVLPNKEPRYGYRLLHWLDFFPLLIVFFSLAWLAVNFSFLIAVKILVSLLAGIIVFIKMRRIFLYNNFIEGRGSHPFSVGVWIFSLLSVILTTESMNYSFVFLFGSIAAFVAPLLVMILTKVGDPQTVEAR